MDAQELNLHLREMMKDARAGNALSDGWTSNLLAILNATICRIERLEAATREGAATNGKRNERQTLGQLGGDGQTGTGPSEGRSEQTKPRC